MKQILLITAGALSALAASAQTTIFYDDFSGAYGSINGTAPTTAPGSETWVSTSYVRDNGGGKLSGGANGVSTARSTSYLATTLSAGNIYELSVDIYSLAPTSTSSQLAGFGFFNTINNKFVSYNNQSTTSTPWAYLQTQSATNLGDVSFRPEGVYDSEVSDIDSNFTVTTSQNYKLVLNTSDTDTGTAGDQFSVALYVDGVQYGSTFTYDAIASAALLTDVVGVGVTADLIAGGADARFDNFLLTSTAVVPEPSTFALLAGLCTLGAVTARRRRK
jgi:PEP-CTERM putative exosortase interaction domain